MTHLPGPSRPPLHGPSPWSGILVILAVFVGFGWNSAQEITPRPLEGLMALEIDLPGTHVVKGVEGVNFMVNYIALAEPRKDGKFAALGVYIGFDPSNFCKGSKARAGGPTAIGPWKVQWTDCPSAKTPDGLYRETHIAPGSGELRLHVFISGNDPEEMDLLEEFARSLRPRKE